MNALAEKLGKNSWWKVTHGKLTILYIGNAFLL
jgi:hypothetical protein